MTVPICAFRLARLAHRLRGSSRRIPSRAQVCGVLYPACLELAQGVRACRACKSAAQGGPVHAGSDPKCRAATNTHASHAAPRRIAAGISAPLWSAHATDSIAPQRAWRAFSYRVRLAAASSKRMGEKGASGRRASVALLLHRDSRRRSMYPLPFPSTRPPAACPLRMNLPTRLVPSSRRNLQTESVGSFHKFRKVPLKVFRKISDRNFRKLPSVSDCDGAEFKSRTSSHLSYARRHGPYSGLIPGTRVLQFLGRPAARSCSVPPSNVTRAPPRPGPPGCLFACSQKGLVSLGTSSVLPTGPRPPAGAPSSGAPGRAWMPHQAGASSAHRISRTSSFADGAGSSRGMGRRSESLMQGRPDQAAQGH